MKKKQLKRFFFCFLSCLFLAVHVLFVSMAKNTKSQPSSARTPSAAKRFAEINRKQSFNFSLTRRIDYPWKDDPNCANFSVRFAEDDSFRPTLLVSYPGSGNTWLRYLIQGITGVFTGSIYNDYDLAAEDGSTIVQKTHLPAPSMHSKDIPIEQTKVILLIRSPFESIISQHNYMYASHMGFASVKNFVREDWSEFAKNQLKLWFDTITQWLLRIQSDNLLVVHYENMKKNLRNSIENVASFLGVEIDKERLICTTIHANGSFVRPKQYFPEKEFFSTDILLLMKKLLAKLNRILKQKNIEYIPFYVYQENWSKRRIYRCPVRLSMTDCLSEVDDLNNDISIKTSSIVPIKFFFMHDSTMVKSYVKAFVKKQLNRFLEHQLIKRDKNKKELEIDTIKHKTVMQV